MSDSQKLSQNTNQKAEESAATARAPKVALVCDWLTTPGGAEKVLLELHQMYPQAPIYTSQYRPKKIDWFDDAEVKTGWLQIFPAFLRKMLKRAILTKKMPKTWSEKEPFMSVIVTSQPNIIGNFMIAIWRIQASGS